MSTLPASSFPSNATTPHSLRITPLGAPSPESSFLDWEYAITMHLRHHKLAYVLREVDVKDRPSNWEEDNLAVISVLIQTCNESNYKYLRSHGDNARAAWMSLRQAHQDSSSGGRIFWLYKLISMKMAADDDIEAHIDKMHQAYEKLDALITTDQPLTADDIYATALVISLPADWTSCISSLMQSSSTDSSTIVRTLKQEATRRKSKLISVIDEQSASKSLSRPSESRSQRCTFCNRDSHSLDSFQTAARILREAKDAYAKKRRGNKDKSFKGKNNQSRYHTKAGKTEHVVLGSLSDSEDEEATVGSAKTLCERSSSTEVKSTEFLIDSGCSKSMTPFPSVLINKSPSNSTIRLADNSTIVSTTKGFQLRPIDSVIKHRMLLAEDLHEPLLSVSALCDDGFVMLFDKNTCHILNKSPPIDRDARVGTGHRKGSLYYLASEGSRR